MSHYTIEQYTMDRMAIEDTVTKLWRYYDMKWSEEETVNRLATEVFAEEVYVDYKILLGQEPSTYKGDQHARNWYGVMATLDGSIHMIGNVFCDLPYPGQGVKRPDKTIANGQALVVLRKGDKIGRNGGIILVTLSRDKSKGEWEWRICGLQMVRKAFEDGENVF